MRSTIWLFAALIPLISAANDSFIRGFLEGLADSEDFVRLAKCATENAANNDLVMTARKALPHLAHIEVRSLETGLGMLLAAARRFLFRLRPCAAESSVVRKLIDELGNNSITTEKMAKRIVAGPVRFAIDVIAATGGVEGNDLEKGGKAVGDIVRRAVVG